MIYLDFRIVRRASSIFSKRSDNFKVPIDNKQSESNTSDQGVESSKIETQKAAHTNSTGSLDKSAGNNSIGSYWPLLAPIGSN